MKKKISFVMAFILLFTFSTTAMAASPTDDAEYKHVLNEINEEYNLNLGYNPVDPAAVSLSEYEEIVRSVAIQQKELKDHIAQREEHPLSEISTIAATTKTVTKDVWNFESYFTITATYDVDGIKISNPRSISIGSKFAASLNGLVYFPYDGYPTTKIIDSGRTLTVTYYGIYTASGKVTLSNIEFYTEFYFDS